MLLVDLKQNLKAQFPVSVTYCLKVWCCVTCWVLRMLEEVVRPAEEVNLESAVMMFSPSELEDELLDSKTDLSAMVLTKVP